MRTTKKLSISLPPEMLARAEELARNEHRTMSELMREALRHYDRDRWWDEVNAFGRQTAQVAGARTDDDVVDSIHRLRQQS
jgi:predicted transcriptional regulator